MAQRKVKQRQRVVVTKDASFQRSVADKVLAIDLGKDFELAFLQASPSVKAMVDLDETLERADLEGALYEVTRVRLGMPVLLGLIMNTLEAMILAKRVKPRAIISAIQQWVPEVDDGSEDEK